MRQLITKIISNVYNIEPLSVLYKKLIDLDKNITDQQYQSKVQQLKQQFNSVFNQNNQLMSQYMTVNVNMDLFQIKYKDMYRLQQLFTLSDNKPNNIINIQHFNHQIFNHQQVQNYIKQQQYHINQQYHTQQHQQYHTQQQQQLHINQHQHHIQSHQYQINQQKNYQLNKQQNNYQLYRNNTYQSQQQPQKQCYYQTQSTHNNTNAQSLYQSQYHPQKMEIQQYHNQKYYYSQIISDSFINTKNIFNAPLIFSNQQNYLNPNHSNNHNYIEKDLLLILQKNPSYNKINVNQVKIQIKYLQSSVDYQNYTSNNYSLKQSLKQLIIKFFKSNYIQVNNSKISHIKILQDISFQKNTQSGNYQFNPFFDSLQIWIRFKDINKSFKESFVLQGNIQSLQITSQSFKLNKWNKNFMKLTPKSPIKQLVQYYCNKRQMSNQKQSLMLQLHEHKGGADIIQDMFGWEKTDYSKNIQKTTYAIQLQLIVQQIKYQSNIIKQKSDRSKQKQKCFKTSISHKILRYVVYKLKGKKGVKQIAWLNMENFQNAINIIRQEVHNQQLINQLQQYFQVFTLDPPGPDEKPIPFSRGLMLHGPPGTGKTVLTQILPDLIGFHLIQIGLSSANFNKTHVGQTGRMIQNLVNRAVFSPYLLCSVSIDQVDGLVPDRRDKDQKNKGQGISMLLSVIGGNRDVPNLIFLTSTNYIKKIDEAIGRRFNGQFQVGRPNPRQRFYIIKENINYLKDKYQLLQHLIKITTNFTGAALCRLCHTLRTTLQVKRKKRQLQQLDKDEINEAAILVARQLKITLGFYTLPQIYRNNQADKGYMFTETFFKRIARGLLLISHKQGDEFHVVYANQIKKYEDGRYVSIFDKQQQVINIQRKKNQYSFDSIVRQVENIFKPKRYKIGSFHSTMFKDKQEQKFNIAHFIDKVIIQNKQKAIIIIQQQKKSNQQTKLLQELKIMNYNYPNLFVIYYVNKYSDLLQQGNNNFGVKNLKNKFSIKSILYQIQRKQLIKLQIQQQQSNNQKMEIQNNLSQQDQSQLQQIFFSNPQMTDRQKKFLKQQKKQEKHIEKLASKRKSQHKPNNNMLFIKQQPPKQLPFKHSDENYSGRIMVQLNQQTQMAFQLKTCKENQSKIGFRLFLKSQNNTSPTTVIPELVDFFTNHQVSYLLLIDYQLLLQNDAFQQKKVLEILQQKMSQAKNYKKSAVIIDIDSLIMINQSVSDTFMGGRSISYNIQNFNLFQILINYMKSFASTFKGDSRWITMIIKHPQLINIIKKHIDWPKYPQQIQKQKQQKQLDKQKRCFRCNAFYTQRKNKQQRKCMQHPGRIIDTSTADFDNLSQKQLKAKMINERRREDKVDQNRYVYACCLKGLNDAGENAYYHIEQDKYESMEDELYQQKMNKSNKWKQQLKYFRGK